MSKRHQQQLPLMRGRLITVLLVLALLATGLIARAIDLQLLRNDFYQNQGDARFVRQVPISAGRGMILDRNGQPLAISTPVDSVWCVPRDLLAAGERLSELAEVLNMDAEALAQSIAQRSERQFHYIKRHVSPDMAAQIRELKIPGVQLEREYRRYYPAGEVASHIVGFTNIDDQGQEGLELAFDEWLQGEPGAKRVIKDLYGNIIESVDLIQEARPGSDLVTSIDRRLQYTAYRALMDGVQRHQAKSASAVVLDIETGEVLAMVNYPSYNPNQRNARPTGAMRNRAVTDFFEPGSVIKPFTVAAALESGLYTPDTPINTSPGWLKVGTFTVEDVKDYGLLNVTGLLTKSSNVGISKMASALEAEHLWNMYHRFGFGEVTGSGFPGESPGILPSHQRWREVEQSAISYGYGIATTTMQLAQAYMAIANGGRIRAPSFVKGATNPDSAVIDPQLARQLVSMLETVTGPAGSGHRAAVPNYRVAGKTGTSRKASEGGYNFRYNASFAGIAPASDPKVVVVVAVNDPATKAYYGGQVAAPVFGDIMEAALRLQDGIPDGLLGQPNSMVATVSAP